MLMLLTLIMLVLVTVALVVAGVVALAHGDEGEAKSPRPSGQAREKLQQLADGMAVELDEHALEVSQIASVLSGEPDQDKMLSTVARLVEVNQKMQQQLVTAEEQLNTQARQIESHAFEARTDALTQVANRRAFDDALQRRIEEQQRRGEAASIMLLDVDHFKKFNDTYGHQAGDEVLRQVARVLRQETAENDLVARYGGEEFAIIFAAPLPGARAPAERARAAVGAAKIRFGGRDLRVTVSAGLAELQPGEDEPALLQRVDGALYASKEAGRNCLHWNDGHKNHHLQHGHKAAMQALARDDLSELLGTEWTADADELPEAVSCATADYVSSKPVFVDDMIRRLAQWKRDQTPLCLMLVQIDGFAEGIQKHGEEGAGLALRVVAQILQANMRDMDHVSRMGNDTFSLLLPAVRLEDGVRFAERLRLAAEQCRLPSKAKGFSLRLTIGVVETNAGDDMRRLLQRGRNALQVAIDRGRNCVYAQDISGTLAKTQLAVHA